MVMCSHGPASACGAARGPDSLAYLCPTSAQGGLQGSMMCTLKLNAPWRSVQFHVPAGSVPIRLTAKRSQGNAQGNQYAVPEQQRYMQTIQILFPSSLPPYTPDMLDLHQV